MKQNKLTVGLRKEKIKKLNSDIERVGFDFIFYTGCCKEIYEKYDFSEEEFMEFVTEEYDLKQKDIHRFRLGINNKKLVSDYKFHSVFKTVIESSKEEKCINLFLKRYGLVKFKDKNFTLLVNLFEKEYRAIEPLCLYRALIVTTIDTDYDEVINLYNDHTESENNSLETIWKQNHLLSKSSDLRKVIHYVLKDRNYQPSWITIYNDFTTIDPNLDPNLILTNFKQTLVNPTFSIDYYTLEDIDLMSGYEFEEFLVLLFTEMGFKSKVTSKSNDQGCDIILERKNERIIAQAKRYTKKVGNYAIQEIVAALPLYSANTGIVISNSIFTKSAIELAKENKILLYDRYKLEELLILYHLTKEN